MEIKVSQIRLRSSRRSEPESGANKSKIISARTSRSHSLSCVSVVPPRIIFEPQSRAKILICVIMNSFSFSSLLVQRLCLPPRLCSPAEGFCSLRYRPRWHILISPATHSHLQSASRESHEQKQQSRVIASREAGAVWLRVASEAKLCRVF
jgi:hypothetical protein